jgi:hypothetical protein
MRSVRRLDDALERFWIALATRSSGRAIAVMAVLLYGGIGLALPLVLGWPVSWLITANILGTGFAGTLILVWLGVQVQAAHRRHLLEWTTDLRLLDAAEFEWLVGEVFRRDGWQVEETGRQDGPDGNVDLRLTRNGDRRIVQCKRWTSWLVKVEDVRAFGGTLLEAGLPGAAGIFVTLSDFTSAARDHAKKTGLILVDNRDLYARVERVRTAEACPKCHSAMVLDRSSRGWWFRCVAAGCDGKRDLGKEPARAVELLTQVP